MPPIIIKLFDSKPHLFAIPWLFCLLSWFQGCPPPNFQVPRHMSKIIDHRKLHFLCETFFLAPFNEMACSERAASGAVLRKSSSFSLLQKHKILLYPLIILSASLIFPSFFFVSACPPGKWGEDCGNDCPCLNGAQCNPLTGECTCTPGWHGNFSQF